MSNNSKMAASENAASEFARHATQQMKIAGDMDFSTLIAPVTPEEFFADYWEKKPLVTKGRAASCFAPLFSLKDVDRAIGYFRPEPGHIDLVSEAGFVRDNFLSVDGRANLKLVREMFLKGNTIILNGLHETWEPLALFALALEGALNHPVAISSYVTPPNFHGVSPHFDTQENFLLQVEGVKHWKVYGPTQEFPRVEGSYTRVPQEKLAEPLLETALEPGDVLYIPRGFAHEGAAGNRPSLHITVDVLVRTWHDFMTDALAGIAERNPKLRRSLPVGFLNDERAMQSLEAEFGELLDLFRRSVSIKDAVNKHMELLAVRKTPPADGHFAALHAEITADTPLKRRRSSVVRVIEENGIAGIQFSGNQIIGPAKIAEALRYVASETTLTPAALPGQLTDNEKLVLARRMVLAGLLTLA